MFGRGTSFLGHVGVEPGGPLIATRISGEIFLKQEIWLLWVTGAVIEFSTDEFLITAGAPEFLQSGEHLPKDVVPRDLLLPQKHNKLINIPVFIGDMFGDNLTIDIDEEVGP